MRIISGKHRGKKLKEFDGMDIRPTADRAKEALFNILQGDILDSVFLDLFSGTGGIGIEAISRGAKEVVFVDSSKESMAIVKFNLESIKEKGVMVLNDGLSYLKSTGHKFDIIFMDPPYKYDGVKVLLEEIKNRKILYDGGFVVYEHRSSDEPFSLDGWETIDTRKYGIARFEFLRIV